VASVVETRELTRSFDTGIALDGLSLEIEAGEVIALLGPNGAGKTTTVRLLNGVLAPDHGSARVLGLDPLRDGTALRRLTGVLTENAGLDERLTARENLEYTARIRGIGRDAARHRSGDLLEQFGLAEKADHLVVGFSTGQRKRVALARALLHDPQLLFLDEPTSGLDPAATRDVAALIQQLASEHGRTIVLATHFLAEAGRLADRMAILHRGKLHAFGRPDELARALWEGLDAVLDLGGPAAEDVLRLLHAVDGVDDVAATPTGASIHVHDREVLPRVVAALVAREVPVYAAEPRPRTLEDVYFEIEARAGAQLTDIDRAALRGGVTPHEPTADDAAGDAPAPVTQEAS
jgi:ABC-2 type transport system ATP-binding protein